MEGPAKEFEMLYASGLLTIYNSGTCKFFFSKFPVLNFATGVAYGANYGNPEVGYAGHPYPASYGMNPVSHHLHLSGGTFLH